MGREPVQFDAGTWRVEGDRLCREWEKTPPRRLCWRAVSDADQVAMFDGNGLVYIKAQLREE